MQPPCTGLTNLPRYVHTHPHYELRFYVLMALFFLMVANLKSENDSHVAMRSKRALNAEGPGAIILLQVQNEVRYLSRFASLLEANKCGRYQLSLKVRWPAFPSVMYPMRAGLRPESSSNVSSKSLELSAGMAASIPPEVCGSQMTPRRLSNSSSSISPWSMKPSRSSMIENVRPGRQ